MPRSTALDANAIAPGSLVVSAVVGITLATGGFVIGIGATGLAAGTTSFWYLSRATGFVAYLLLWGSVTWGLLLSTGTGRAWMRPPRLLEAHQFLSAAGAGFACFHSLVLMGDRYVSFPLRAVILPFGGSYEPLLVAFGQIAAWLSLLLIASFHVRRHIGGRLWRRLHYASFVAFWLAVAHGLLLGPERTTLWANAVYLTTASVVTFLTSYRVLVTEGVHSVLVGRHGAQIPPAKSLRAV
jgi:predicted ferric reductase